MANLSNTLSSSFFPTTTMWGELGWERVTAPWSPSCFSWLRQDLNSGSLLSSLVPYSLIQKVLEFFRSLAFLTNWFCRKKIKWKPLAYTWGRNLKIKSYDEIFINSIYFSMEFKMNELKEAYQHFFLKNIHSGNLSVLRNLKLSSHCTS